jgi:hypothetical protein
MNGSRSRKARSLRGFERYDLPSGVRYLKIHHYADPEKDDRWLENVRREMSDTPDDFRQQILMDETVYGGMPVYTGYVDDAHCPARWREKPIPLVKGALYFGGWDGGQTLTPAFVLVQVVPEPFMMQCIAERVSMGEESMNEFAPRVLELLRDRLDPELRHQVRHFGDATVVQRSGSNKKSAQDVAKEFGIHITPMSNEWAGRHAAVSWALSQETDTHRLFWVDGFSCPTLRQGFQGAYKWHMSASGESQGPGAIVLQPLKNAYSHIHDGLQQVMQAIKTEQLGGFRTRVTSGMRNTRDKRR